MKRTPLTRKTPLTSRAAPKAKTRKPLARSAPKPRAAARDRAPRAKTKSAPRDTGPTRAMREAVKVRDGGRCVRCGDPAGSIHHRKPRGMGGTHGAESDRINGPAWLLSLCGSGVTGCHGWVEGNRTRAEELGYLILRNGPEVDAATVPVRVRAGWRLFGDDLSVTRCDPPARAA